jgi:trk system potassium uptake protein TrkA
MNLLSIKKGRLSIVRIDIPDDAPVVGQELKNIKLPPNSVLISIIRGSDIVVPSGLTKILADDEIIAITAIDNEKELTKALIGNL